MDSVEIWYYSSTPMIGKLNFDLYNMFPITPTLHEAQIKLYQFSQEWINVKKKNTTNMHLVTVTSFIETIW